MRASVGEPLLQDGQPAAFPRSFRIGRLHLLQLDRHLVDLAGELERDLVVRDRRALVRADVRPFVRRERAALGVLDPTRADLAPVEAPAETAPDGLTTAEPPAGAAPPIPNFDQLTVPSLRARLRGLDADGVQALLDLMVLAFWTDTTRIATFMLANDFTLMQFVQKVSAMCRGKAYFTTPQTLGNYLLMDFMSRRMKTVH